MAGRPDSIAKGQFEGEEMYSLLLLLIDCPKKGQKKKKRRRKEKENKTKQNDLITSYSKNLKEHNYL